MIPVLTPPAVGVRSAGFGTWAPRLVGLLLLLLALTGTFAWMTRLSPFPLERWAVLDLQHRITITEPGTYTLFEEGDGAASRRGDARVAPSVRSIAGRPIPVRSVIDAIGRSPQTYDVFIHEGRAVGEIDIDRPGQYIIAGFATANESGGRDRFRNPGGLALGAPGEPSPWGTWVGLIVLAGIPAVAGTIVLVLARVARPLELGPVLRSRADGRV